MDEFRARRVVDSLRDHGVNAHLLRGGVSQFGVRVSLPGGRQAEWDTDGTAGLEAQVMRDGMLVGYVPQIDGSEDFDEAQTVDAIARTDYDQTDYDHAELILDAYQWHTSAAGGARGAAMLGDEMIDEASRKMALVIAGQGRAAGLQRTSKFEPPASGAG